MKKLMVLLCAGMLLAGCGSKKEEAKTDENRESKVCTIEQAGIKMELGASAVDDIIDKVDVKIIVPLQGVSESAVTDEMKSQLEEAALKQAGLSKGDGVDVETDVNDGNLSVKVSIDINKASDEAKKALNLDDAKDSKLSDFVKNAEAGGYVYGKHPYPYRTRRLRHRRLRVLYWRRYGSKIKSPQRSGFTTQ